MAIVQADTEHIETSWWGPRGRVRFRLIDGWAGISQPKQVWVIEFPTDDNDFDKLRDGVLTIGVASDTTVLHSDAFEVVRVGSHITLDPLGHHGPPETVIVTGSAIFLQKNGNRVFSVDVVRGPEARAHSSRTPFTWGPGFERSFSS